MLEEILKLKVLKTVKTLLTTSFINEHNLDDELIYLFLENANMQACSYCNIDKLPAESYTNLAFLTMDLIKEYVGENNKVQILREGERSIHFNSISPLESRNLVFRGFDNFKAVRTI